MIRDTDLVFRYDFSTVRAMQPCSALAVKRARDALKRVTFTRTPPRVMIMRKRIRTAANNGYL